MRSETVSVPSQHESKRVALPVIKLKGKDGEVIDLTAQLGTVKVKPAAQIEKKAVVSIAAQVEKKLSTDAKLKKRSEKFTQQLGAISSAMALSGCCGGHTANTSNSESSTSSSHHGHDHCKKCDGELVNGKCPPCNRRVTRSTVTESIPVYLPPPEPPRRPRFQPTPQPSSRFESGPARSIITEAARRGQDRVILLGGLLIYHIY